MREWKRKHFPSVLGAASSRSLNHSHVALLASDVASGLARHVVVTAASKPVLIGLPSTKAACAKSGYHTASSRRLRSEALQCHMHRFFPDLGPSAPKAPLPRLVGRILEANHKQMQESKYPKQRDSIQLHQRYCPALIHQALELFDLLGSPWLSKEVQQGVALVAQHPAPG